MTPYSLRGIAESLQANILTTLRDKLEGLVARKTSAGSQQLSWQDCFSRQAYTVSLAGVLC